MLTQLINAISRHSIRRRIIVQFCGMSLLISAVFMLLSFSFLYTIEDEFIDEELRAEVQFLTQSLAATGKFAKPRRQYFSLHYDAQSLPDDVRQQYLDELWRSEFYGEQGRHYHLMPIKTANNEMLLLAEVSDRLMVRRLFDIVMTFLLVVGGILMLIACFIAYRLANYTVKPLSDLVTLVDGVKPQKLPDNFAKDYPKNEVGILANTLEQSMKQIKAFVEREQHFTRDASHELRTPISVVKNAAQILELQSELTGEQQEVLDRIKRASFQMEQTVETLLSLAREQSFGQTDAPVNILPLVEKAIINHAYLIEDKPVEVDVDVTMSASAVVSQGVLEILIANLISNAFHYTSEGKVKVSFNDGVFTVADTGPGIAPEIQDKLLEDRVKGANSQGFGIGLSIVRRLCEHYGLELEVISEGQGTNVSIGLWV